MTFRLRRLNGAARWLSSDIDSSGMSVHWSSKENADKFATREDAEKFASRVLEHFPTAGVMVEESE